MPIKGAVTQGDTTKVDKDPINVAEITPYRSDLLGENLITTGIRNSKTPSNHKAISINKILNPPIIIGCCIRVCTVDPNHAANIPAMAYVIAIPRT